MYKILIIEDDNVIAQSMDKHLNFWGYETKYLEDFKDIVPDFIAFGPQLVLLDISLPFYNGFYWCQEIRKLSKVPVIFISSASDNMSIVMAMNMGGDDFISKPFDLNVLIAKVQALLRRTYEFEQAAGLIQHKGAVLSTGDCTLSYHDERVELTKNEYRILQSLMENRGKALSREDIMAKLWESDSYVDDNTLTVNITRLRKKLDGVGLHDFIRTIKGLGYLVD